MLLCRVVGICGLVLRICFCFLMGVLFWVMLCLFGLLLGGCGVFDFDGLVDVVFWVYV